MKERGMLFSGSMVMALLDGRKTQTRRIVKNHNFSIVNGRPHYAKLDGSFYDCPYGVAGDRIWVRETWSGPRLEERARNPKHPMDVVTYRADAGRHEQEVTSWRRSIHMPRWASRITLEITEVRVERLQDISEEDAQAEGVPWPKKGEHGRAFPTCVDAYQSLWESLHGAGSWAANPFVWALTFKKI